MRAIFTAALAAALFAPGLRAAEAPLYDRDPHECTSWIVMPDLTGGKYMFVHKNRDSKSKKIQLYKARPEGKNAWISLSDRGGGNAFAGLNAKGLAVAMNSGDKTDFYSRNKEGSFTPEICKYTLENCSTAEQAVAFIRDHVKRGDYRHARSGSIWFVADAKKAFIIEHDAKHFAAHEVREHFAIRANAWHYPEMLIYSRRDRKSLVAHHRREVAVRSLLFADGTKYGEPVTQEKIAAASRINSFPEDPQCYPLCGSLTNSGSSLRIDCEFPEALSTLFAACGPPRHTAYLPIPFLLDEFPPELAEGTFCDAVFARAAEKRELLPPEKLAEFERTLRRRHEEAVEKGRKILKAGGAVAEVKKLLAEAFRQNWEDLKKLSAGCDAKAAAARPVAKPAAPAPAPAPAKTK